jgi:hypothetical protein
MKYERIYHKSYKRGKEERKTEVRGQIARAGDVLGKIDDCILFIPEGFSN